MSKLREKYEEFYRELKKYEPKYKALVNSKENFTRDECCSITTTGFSLATMENHYEDYLEFISELEERIDE